MDFIGTMQEKKDLVVQGGVETGTSKIVLQPTVKMVPLALRNEPQMLRQFARMHPSYSLNPLLILHEGR